MSGVVLTLPNGEPASGALVKILNKPFGETPPGVDTRSVTTGPDGSFLFDNLEARS